MMYCYRCGKQIQDGTEYCPYCGAKQINKRQGSLEAEDRKNALPVPPLIIGLLIGAIGAGAVFALSRGTAGKTGAAEVTEYVEEAAAEEAAAEEAATEEADVEEAAAEETAEEPAAANTQGGNPRMSIPADALVFNGHSYYLFDNSCNSWDEVLYYCASRGGYPAVIEDSEENAVLFDYMLDMGYDCTFFGYTDHETEGRWKWVDGRTSDYTDWGTNREGEKEPNADTDEEDYAQLDLSMVTGTWNDCAFGWDTVSFICEWDGVR